MLLAPTVLAVSCSTAPERKQYAAGISGTRNFAVMDENFKVLSKSSNGVNSGKTRQGLDCNEDYVYFIQSAATGKPGNCIMVYDWNGNFVVRIDLPHNTLEGETLMHNGNDFFLHVYRGGGNGGRVYKLTGKIAG